MRARELEDQLEWALRLQNYKKAADVRAQLDEIFKEDIVAGLIDVTFEPCTAFNCIAWRHSLPQQQELSLIIAVHGSAILHQNPYGQY